ncbi:alkaline shock response membrane anchor protein AmaP [Microbispora sp. NPDC049125]|uniref:alkaline shock response membrane anchor protein AmaP n=1 Tax=Microbispora sp. NPDC049125 TaxID=3154929 RepID=UPI003464ED14
MGRRMAGVNRIGLFLLGLALLAGGLLALARGLGAFGASAARRPLIEAGSGLAAGRAWFWPAMAGLGIVLGLLGLAWLLAQMRIGRVRRLRLQSGMSGITEVDARPASDAVAAQIGEYPDVRRARAVLRGSSDHPRLDLGVAAGEPADLSALVTRLHDEAVPALRSTLGLRRLPALVRLSLVRPGRHTRIVH